MKTTRKITTPQACELIEKISKHPVDQNYFTSLCRREYFTKSEQIGGKRGPWVHDPQEITEYAKTYEPPPIGRPRKDAPTPRVFKRKSAFRSLRTKTA